MQECLTNISKHANAGQVIINVKQDKKHISLAIEDDGVGCDLSQSPKSFDLAGMKERVQGLMGVMQVETSKKMPQEESDNKNPGTRIMIKLPLLASAIESSSKPRLSRLF